jgi:hypothetical protein
MNRNCLAVALALLMTPASAETIVSVDEFIAAERKKLAESCASVELSEGFVQRVNVNGDGRDDLLVDYHAAQCDESSALFCGAAGCEMDVYLGNEAGGFALLTGFFGYVIDFDQPDTSPPSFVIALHGNECARSGMEACAIRYGIEDGKVIEVGEVAPPAAE